MKPFDSGPAAAMSDDGRTVEVTSTPPIAVGPMPPSTMVEGFFDADIHRGLLEWTLANKDRFEAATVVRQGDLRIDTRARDNLKLNDVGPMLPAIRDRLLAALPTLADNLGCSFPPDVSLELELTAYGDGAFYHAHTDTPLPTSPEERALIDPDPRLLSAVYYFHRQPRAFDGGALRLYRWGMPEDAAGPNDWKDLEPADNRLVAFLSWARHEVRPVSCPSGRFEDYRFALNCWYRTRLPSA